MNNKEGMPFMVYLGLLGINSRAIAQLFLIACVSVALGCLVYGFVEPIYFFGVPMLGAAYWYHYCIKWMDDNSAWDV